MAIDTQIQSKSWFFQNKNLSFLLKQGTYNPFTVQTFGKIASVFVA